MPRRSPRRAAFGLALALCAACAALAAPAGRADEATDALRKEVDELRRKVRALEERAGAPDAASPAEEEDELSALRRDAAGAAEDAEKKGPKAPPTSAGGVPVSGATTTFGGLQQTLNAFNPRMTVFGDFVGRLSLVKHPPEPEIEDELNMREVEVDMRADVDPYSKAVFILAVERESSSDSYAIDIEEGYLTLETLPWNLRAQLGRWRQRFGQANRTHRHDLMQIDYPTALRDFLGEEGLIGDGISLLWLAPGIPLELESTVINGTDETILAGAPSTFPAFLWRADLTLDLPFQSIGSFGSSYLLGWNDDDHGNMTQLIGGDITLMWKPTRIRSAVLQSEVYYLQRGNGDGLRGEIAWGGYSAFTVQPIQQLYLGTRYDWSDYGQQIEDNDSWALSFYASWYTTEFLRFRIGYIHEENRTAFPGGRKDNDVLELQVVFLIGSHPVEPFWVNR
jgi:hypothetical protein